MKPLIKVAETTDGRPIVVNYSAYYEVNCWSERARIVDRDVTHVTPEQLAQHPLWRVGWPLFPRTATQHYWREGS